MEAAPANINLLDMDDEPARLGHGREPPSFKRKDLLMIVDIHATFFLKPSMEDATILRYKHSIGNGQAEGLYK